MATVTSGSLAGAETMTFFAPASRCFDALGRSVKSPVDSITTSAPTSDQGSAPGSRSEKTRISLPSITIPESVASTSPGYCPRIESHLKRWARVFVSVMSLTATQSTSAPRACAARSTFRPMRPKPLMPTFTANPRPFLGSPPSLRTLSAGFWAPGERLRAPRGLVDVAVDDVDHVVPALCELLRQTVGDHHGTVPSAGAADPDRQVRLALPDVGREQVVEQRDQPVVELADAVGALDVVDHRLVAAGQLAQLGLVVRIRQEADVEQEVCV